MSRLLKTEVRINPAHTSRVKMELRRDDNVTNRYRDLAMVGLLTGKVQLHKPTGRHHATNGFSFLTPSM